LQVAVIDAKSEVTESLVTALSPKILVLYGEKTQEAVKTLGKEVTPTKKMQAVAEKLPDEMEVITLS
jgi:hypothetical protein